GKIAVCIVIFGLIVITRHSDCDADRSSLGAAASATSALLVVLDSGWNVPADNRLKFADIYSQLHSGRATEHADFAALKIALKPFAHAIVNRGCMLTRNLRFIISVCTEVKAEIMTMLLFAASCVIS